MTCCFVVARGTDTRLGKGMEEKRTSSTAWVAATALLLLGLVGAYVAGYYLRGTAEDDPFGGDQLRRSYPSEWEATLFRPAARMESALSGREVFTDVSYSAPDGFDPFAP